MKISRRDSITVSVLWTVTIRTSESLLWDPRGPILTAGVDVYLIRLCSVLPSTFLSILWEIMNLVFYYISNKMQRYTVYFVCKLLYMFRVVLSPIIRSTNNCIYSIWYLSHRYCYLPLSWKGWNGLECAVGGVHSNPFQIFHDSGR